MNPDQISPLIPDLSPYCLQHRLQVPKNIFRREEQTGQLWFKLKADLSTPCICPNKGSMRVTFSKFIYFFLKKIVHPDQLASDEAS